MSISELRKVLPNGVENVFRERGYQKEVEKGKEVYRRDEDATRLWYPTQGSVGLYLPTTEGSKHLLQIAREGDMFGYEAMTDVLHRHDAVALEPVVVFGLRRHEFENFVLGNPALAINAFKALVIALNELDEFAARSHTMSGQERVVAALDDFADVGISKTNITQTEIAARAGVTREYVSRTTKQRTLREVPRNIR